jgi:hypothetical protein
MTPPLTGDARRGCRRLTTAVRLALLTLAAATACDTAPTAATLPLAPTAPGAAPSVTATVRGTVWEHGPDGAVRPMARGQISGFQWVERSGTTLGWIPLDADGRYELWFRGPATIALYAGNGGYQPCSALFAVDGEPVTRDLHVVTVGVEFGARLTPAMVAEGMLLTGTVFTSVDGHRVPVPGASIHLDALGGLGVSLARTRTGADGGYALCGTSLGQSPVLHVSAEGFTSTEVFGSELSPGATVDVELSR